MNVLFIASHPDDEVLGCGGTIAKHIENQDDVFILYLSTGRITDLNHIYSAVNELGVCRNNILFGKFEAQHFETVPQSKIADVIADIIDIVSPNILYTHSKNDLNQDHKIAYEATMVATRPNKYFVEKIFAYEVMGSNLQPSPFNPTHFVNIHNHIDKKISAMECYKDEINRYPDPRSISGILIYAEYRGLQCGMKYAESFEVIRTLDNTL